MPQEITKTILYGIAVLGVTYATGAADSPAGDIVDIVAGGSTAIAALLAADKVGDDDDGVIQPLHMVIEVPQAHAYDWAKQGKPGEVR